MPDNARKADEMAGMEPIQKHPDYERVRNVWDGALRVCEKKCRELGQALERETNRVVEYSDRVSALLSEKADLHARLASLQASATRPAADPDEAVLREHGHTKATCPDCGAPGFNTEFGFWKFECGAEILTCGEVDTPCPSATSPARARGEG